MGRELILSSYTGTVNEVSQVIKNQLYWAKLSQKTERTL